MSMPRAATSVATRTGVRPSLNAVIARLRAFCGLPPCSALALTPVAAQAFGQPVAPCLVRTNRIVRPSRAAISVTTPGLSRR